MGWDATKIPADSGDPASLAPTEPIAVPLVLGAFRLGWICAPIGLVAAGFIITR